VAHYRTPAESRGTSQHGASNLSETALPLGAALIVIVLLSLGLWWVHLVSGFAINFGLAGVDKPPL
jgi:hypothetical protein